MAIKEFSARVVNGKLDFTDSLESMEGKEVTVSVRDAASPRGGYSDYDWIPPFMTQEEYEADQTEPPEGVDVERDVYVKMPFQSKIIENPVIVKGSSIGPCIIMPEELPDE